MYPKQFNQNIEIHKIDNTIFKIRLKLYFALSFIS